MLDLFCVASLKSDRLVIPLLALDENSFDSSFLKIMIHSGNKCIDCTHINNKIGEPAPQIFGTPAT